MKNICPICYSNSTKLLYKANKHENYRDYFHCDICDFIFVDKTFFLSKQQEKNRYLEHNNSFKDIRYREFLQKMYTAIVPLLKKGASGLDYGSGTCQLLKRIFNENNFNVTCYDPFFTPNKNALKTTYDFIVSTETAEHFYNPIKEFKTMSKLIKPNFHIGIMTNRVESIEQFPSWYYHNDPTHVSFYSKKTFIWIARKFKWNYIFHKNNIVIFTNSKTL